jgi:DHA1 family inner membrane transport protein
VVDREEAQFPATPLETRQTWHRVTWRLGVAGVVRLFFNTAVRFAYPFAAALGRGLGVPLTSITSLIAAQQLAGLFGLISGPLSDRAGRRRMMLAGCAMLAGGMLLGGALSLYWAILLALFLAGLGKVFFDPALQSYIGDWVPYEKRGRAFGLSEFAWAGSLLVGVPLVALLISKLGWRSPFFLLGGAGLLSAAAVMIWFPRDPQQGAGSNFAAGVWQGWRRVGQEPAALYTLGFGFLVGGANQILFVVYGVWLEDAYGLSIVALGATSLILGFAELAGEGLTASLADRLGLKRAVIAGTVALVLSYLLLPALGRTLVGAVAALFIVFLIFEFTVVTTSSFVIEILPGARATILSNLVAASSLGRMIGVVVGGLVWLEGGLVASALCATVIAGAGLACLVWGLRDWHADPERT